MKPLAQELNDEIYQEPEDSKELRDISWIPSVNYVDASDHMILND